MHYVRVYKLSWRNGFILDNILKDDDMQVLVSGEDNSKKCVEKFDHAAAAAAEVEIEEESNKRAINIEGLGDCCFRATELNCLITKLEQHRDDKNRFLCPYLGYPVEDYINEATAYEESGMFYLVSDIGIQNEPKDSMILNSFEKLMRDIQFKNEDQVRRKQQFMNEQLALIAFAMCTGLSTLHENFHFHGMLTPDDVHYTWTLDSKGCFKCIENISISGYGQSYIVNQKLSKRGMLSFCAPEYFLEQPITEGHKYECKPKWDVWAMGIILAKLAGFENCLPLKGGELEHAFRLLELEDKSDHPLSYIEVLLEKEETNGNKINDVLDANFIDFISRCLYINPNDRDSTFNLCSNHPLFQEFKNNKNDDDTVVSDLWCLQGKDQLLSSGALYFQFRSCCNWFKELNLLSEKHQSDEILFVETCDIPMYTELERVYYYDYHNNNKDNQSNNNNEKYTILGSSPSPPPSPTTRRRSTKTQTKVLFENQLSFIQIVSKIQRYMYKYTIYYDDPTCREDLTLWTRKLIFQYPNQTWSSSFRGVLWMTLLGVYLKPCSSKFNPILGGCPHVASVVESKFDALEPMLDWEHQVNRQLEQDVPRCHQYHLLLRSEKPKQSLKRILKAWTLRNGDCEYWQGLDSIAAVCVSLYLGNEVIAFTVFDQIVSTYLPGMFSISGNQNSKHLYSRLRLMEQLLFFHNPTLALHLQKLGVNPDLYAIPWILTMFAHVLPIHIVSRVWDYLFIEKRPTYTLLVLCVSILVQLRQPILYIDEFGECVAFLTRLPISLEKLISRSILLTERAKTLTPSFEQQSEYFCPVISLEKLEEQELLEFVFVSFVESDEKPDFDMKQTISFTSNEQTLGAIDSALVQNKQKHMIGLLCSEKQKTIVEAFANFLVKEKLKPFVAIIKD